METTNSTPADSPELERIKKLMRRAEDGAATPAEAEQALAAAMRLASRLGVNLEEIDISSEVNVEPFEEIEFTPGEAEGKAVTGRLPVTHKFIERLLVRYFRVEVIFGRKTVSLIGRKSNVMLANYVYGFLYREFSRRWRKAKRELNLHSSDRASFYYGIFVGLDTKLKDEMGEQHAEIQQKLAERAADPIDEDAPLEPPKEGAPVTSLEMVLIGEKEKLDQEVVNRHPRLRYVKRDMTKGAYDNTAYAEGQKAGAEISIKPAIQ